MGAFWGAWGTWDCNWHSRHVYININHYNNFTKIHYRRGDHYRFYKDGQDNQPWRHDPRRPDGVVYGKQRPSLTVRPNTSNFRKYDQGTIRSPTINLRENVRPTINAPKSSSNNQTSIKKLPANDLRVKVANQVNTKPPATIDLKSDAGNQSSEIASTSDLKAQEFTTSSTLISNVESDTSDQRIARSSTNDSSRNHTLAARGRGRNRYGESYNLQPNRQILPPSKDSGVLREGPINVVGR